MSATQAEKKITALYERLSRDDEKSKGRKANSSRLFSPRFRRKNGNNFSFCCKSWLSAQSKYPVFRIMQPLVAQIGKPGFWKTLLIYGILSMSKSIATV